MNLNQSKETFPKHFKHILSQDAFNDQLNNMRFERHLKWLSTHSEKKSIKRSMTNSIFILLLVVASILVGYQYGLNETSSDSEYALDYTTNFQQDNTIITYDEDTLSVSDIANMLEPSLVAITNEMVQDSFFGETIGTSSGSGIIYDITNEGIYIMTNNHVVENSSNLLVNFSGTNLYPASIIGADADTDLAVIFIDDQVVDSDDLNKLFPVQLGNSDLINVGDTAIAIGNPLGYNNTVTLGIISAVDRIISEDLNALSLIQTDAAINPGNSGGALVNAKGQLIGINTIKISDTSVEGIGFAIPINSAIPILKELMTKGYVSKPFIGIYGKDVTEELAKVYDIPMGVFVSDIVPRSPASRSSLKTYDIIVAIDDIPIQTMMDINRVINEYNIGDEIKVSVLREIKEEFINYEVNITIGDKHDY